MNDVVVDLPDDLKDKPEVETKKEDVAIEAEYKEVEKKEETPKPEEISDAITFDEEPKEEPKKEPKKESKLQKAAKAAKAASKKTEKKTSKKTSKKDPKSKIIEKDVTMTTDVVDKKTGESLKSEDETLTTREFDEAPAEVYIRKGLTVNLGQFESFRIDVGVNLPCKKSEVKSFVMTAGKVIDQRIIQEINNIRQNHRVDGRSQFNAGVKL